MKKLLVLSPLLLLMLANCSFATTLHFDEFGTSPLLDVNGMHVFGVTFGFISGTADYNGQLGTAGNTVLVSDPLLLGPTTGTLTLAFDDPTPLLQFDLVLNSIDFVNPISPAFTVTLSTAEVLVGSTSVQPGGVFSEGTFQYTGAPVTGASITFFNGSDTFSDAVTTFGLDNLTYQTPEPATQVLFAGALLALGVIGRRKILR